MTFFASSPTRRRILSAVSLWIGCTICTVSMQPMLLASTVTSTPEAYRSIRQYLNAGHANDAISLLQKQLSLDSGDAAAHHLLCRVYLQEERWTEAEQECEQSVQLEPNNSNYHLWLGRAYGGAAAHASLGSAYVLARKVHAEFDTAIRLDPRNISALSDLGA